jgi:hypothetical protein
MHAQEGDDVHLVPEDIDVDLHILAEPCKMTDILEESSISKIESK